MDGVPTEPRHPLLQAVLDGDLLLLKEMAGVVAADVGIRARALTVAVMEGRLDMCRCLVEDHGVDVNQRTFTGDTPLAISATYGTPATTRYLLDRGADPTLAGALWPPLHAAASFGQCEIVELLLSTGIDVDHFDSVYGTALHVAATNGQDGSMNILLQHHADPNKVFRLDSTPLRLAMISESLECVKLLIKAGADVNKIDYTGVTYLMIAAGNGLSDTLKCLLDAGANPDIDDGFGTTPIEIAALQARWDMVAMLFPLTSPISRLPDWSVDGIISHVQSFGLKPRAMSFQPSPKGLANLLAHRSFCMLHAGIGKEALSDAARCTVLRPLWPKGYYRLGAAFMLLQDYGKAAQTFEAGLKLDPTNADMANALREAQETARNPPRTRGLECLHPFGMRRSWSD
ncbi:serine/threonine-protein phosphatase 6 regulatory ankyrin repeat subunit B-like isoform X2 [Triticum urartu]|uniref:serine/threonine-protein phosphatase 6 regulatory ankyrin repeat subunit B-like isoform X2 n=1 Tax=Triticum urartu TaxID=4572 RepID=UPI0020430165|nr:serine/threonine-protein phosphatase 6 regulatory ankyrin repeat subunit B-like isoform X2 [Triticum urartu]